MASENGFSRQSLTGWLTGLLAPPAGFTVFCYFFFSGQTITEVWRMFEERHVLPHVISLSVIVNLVCFFAFLKADKDASARGVLGATFLYVFVVLYLKFL
ncbi:MAG: hypothetical protein RL213_62 [Bacteroidota bacterium]|jgi:hypothetical protein